MTAHARPRLALTLVLLLALLAGADSASAARYRAVRPSAPRGLSGPCHTFGFVPAGLQASYVATTSSGNASYTLTYVKDTAAQSLVKQKVTTPQATADAQTTIDFETVGTLRAAKHIEVLASTSAPVIGKITFESDLEFVPSMTWGPDSSWCQGAKWTVPATTITTTTRTSAGPPIAPTIVTTLEQTGEVLAVGEAVTVQAGTFQTVKYRGVAMNSSCLPGSSTCTAGVVPVVTWLWMDHPIVVKQETYDAAGVLTSTTQLTLVTGASVPPLQFDLEQEEPDVPSRTDGESERAPWF